MRTWLLCAMTLACAMGAGLASAQSLRDIVDDGEVGRLPAPAPPAQAACTPPGMPALSELVGVGQRTLIAPVEGADETVTVTAVGLVRKDHLARYRLGETSLDFIIYFVRGHLAAVDDHPGDPTEPDLVDTGMVSRRGAALAQGTPMCQWERLPRTGRGGDRGVMPADRI